MEVDFAALARALEQPLGDPEHEWAVDTIARLVAQKYSPTMNVTAAGLEPVETEWSPAWVARKLEEARQQNRDG